MSTYECHRIWRKAVLNEGFEKELKISKSIKKECLTLNRNWSCPSFWNPRCKNKDHCPGPENCPSWSCRNNCSRWFTGFSPKPKKKNLRKIDHSDSPDSLKEDSMKGDSYFGLFSVILKTPVLSSPCRPQWFWDVLDVCYFCAFEFFKAFSILRNFLNPRFCHSSATENHSQTALLFSIDSSSHQGSFWRLQQLWLPLGG